MTTRKLDKKQWREFFDGISKLLEGKQAEIRFAGPRRSGRGGMAASARHGL